MFKKTGDERNQFQWEEKLIEVLADRRHTWLNHLQVMLSFLKLGREKDAEQYIHDLTQELIQESHLSQLGHAMWAEYLLTFNTFHPDLKLEVEIPAPFRLYTLNVDAERLVECMRGILETYSQHVCKGAVPAHIYLTLVKREEELVCSFDFNGCYDYQSCDSHLKKWLKIIESRGGTVESYIHRPDESYLEFKLSFQSNEVHA